MQIGRRCRRTANSSIEMIQKITFFYLYSLCLNNVYWSEKSSVANLQNRIIAYERKKNTSFDMQMFVEFCNSSTLYCGLTKVPAEFLCDKEEEKERNEIFFKWVINALHFGDFLSLLLPMTCASIPRTNLSCSACSSVIRFEMARSAFFISLYAASSMIFFSASENKKCLFYLVIISQKHDQFFLLLNSIHFLSFDFWYIAVHIDVNAKQFVSVKKRIQTWEIRLFVHCSKVELMDRSTKRNSTM